MTSTIISSQGGGGSYSLIWPIWGCAAGQGRVFGLFVLNRVYKVYVFVLNRMYILSFVLSRDLKLRVLS